MGAKKGKKTLQEPQKNKKTLQMDPASAAESSTLTTNSFIEGLQQSEGAPLHSTALDDDLAPAEEEPVQRKRTTQATNPEEKKDEKKPKSTPQKRKRRSPATPEPKGKTAVRRKSSGDADAARAVKKQKVKSRKKSERTSAAEPPAASEESSPQNHRDVLSSDEELDQSWKPSPKKQKRLSSKTSRKSSSGSDRRPEKVTEKTKVKRSVATETEVVLEEFLDFCEQHKATLESTAVKKALDYFASNVKDQLTEKICSSKRLETVMRENTKLASAIQKKRQRLLDAKNELIKSERKLWLLQKDKCELEQRLKDLSQSQTLLRNLRRLNTRYVQHRQKHPDERETYDASSLPALLIEAKHVQTTEVQLKRINDSLTRALRDN